MRILARTNSLDAAQANGVIGESVNVSGMRQASVQVGGTFVGEVTVEASQCGDVWFEFFGRNVGDSSHALAKKVTAPTLLAYENLCGIQFMRVKVTAYTSGEIDACIAGIG
jgi:hypothetical protein